MLRYCFVTLNFNLSSWTQHSANSASNMCQYLGPFSRDWSDGERRVGIVTVTSPGSFHGQTKSHLPQKNRCFRRAQHGLLVRLSLVANRAQAPAEADGYLHLPRGRLAPDRSSLGEADTPTPTSWLGSNRAPQEGQGRSD